jgi:hypothetical protein
MQWNKVACFQPLCISIGHAQSLLPEVFPGDAHLAITPLESMPQFPRRQSTCREPRQDELGTYQIGVFVLLHELGRC